MIQPLEIITLSMYTLIKNNKVIGNYDTAQEAIENGGSNYQIVHRMDKLAFINKVTLTVK